MIRLLPYSPELNPIEQCWKNIKAQLALMPIYTKDDLICAVRKLVRRHIFVPFFSEY